MEIKEMSIYKKMQAITSELRMVGKDLLVGYGKSGYKAVSEGSILKAVKPLEDKYGIYSYPVERVIAESGFLEQEKVDKDTKQIVHTKNLFERIQTTYRFVNIDNPSEYIDIVSFGDGIDTGDKGVGKAMTYADKYALMKAYKIETGDDPDKDASDTYTKSSTKKFNLDQSLINECMELRIPLANIGHWLGKSIIDLTNDDLKRAIAAKKDKLNKGDK